MLSYTDGFLKEDRHFTAAIKQLDQDWLILCRKPRSPYSRKKNAKKDCMTKSVFIIKRSIKNAGSMES